MNVVNVSIHTGVVGYSIPPGRATIGCTSETVSQICRFLNCLSAISVSMLFDSAL